MLVVATQGGSSYCQAAMYPSKGRVDKLLPRPRFPQISRKMFKCVLSDQVKIVKQDAKKQTVSFTNGQITASLQAYALGDKLTQLVVASTLDHSETSATSLVVKSIQQVCTELKATCTVEDNK